MLPRLTGADLLTGNMMLSSMNFYAHGARGLDANAGDVMFLNIDNDLYEGALDVLERLQERFVVGTRLHFHELVEFQRGRCGDDMKCVRPDQEMRALYRFLRRHPCIGLALDPVRGGRPRAQPVVFVVARTECE